MREDAGALGCPRCGAPAAPEATTCAYCRTPLALVACASCFAKVFQGYRHCPRCGAVATRETTAQAGPRPCPQCHAGLGATRVGVVTLGECLACGGIWSDARSFERICQEREAQALVLGTAFLAPPPAAGKPGAAPVPPERYRPCPECGRLMNRINFARCSGVIVDACKAHGVWFDHDELRRVVEFIRAGGMDRARDREKDDLRAERERLRAQEQATAQAERRLSMSMGGETREREPAIDLDDILSVAGDLLQWFHRVD